MAEFEEKELEQLAGEGHALGLDTQKQSWALCRKAIWVGPSDGAGLCWADDLRNGLELGLNWTLRLGPKNKNKVS